MEKYMSKFNIEKTVESGKSVFNAKCSFCYTDNEVSTLNKYRLSKITTFKCTKCGRINNYGEAYNLKTYDKLGHKLDGSIDSVTYDKAMWSDNSRKLRKDI